MYLFVLVFVYEILMIVSTIKMTWMHVFLYVTGVNSLNSHTVQNVIEHRHNVEL